VKRRKRRAPPALHEPERGCVVIDQPQHIATSRLLRLVFDTAALRGFMAPMRDQKIVEALNTYVPVAEHGLRSFRERNIFKEHSATRAQALRQNYVPMTVIWPRTNLTNPL